jgi:hypothetical protein
MKSSIRRILCAVISSFLLLPSAFPQGSLTPPGTPAPTMKTLEQIEPRTPVDLAHPPGDADSAFRIAAVPEQLPFAQPRVPSPQENRNAENLTISHGCEQHHCHCQPCDD